MERIEFRVGDRVTYNPYGTAYPSIVREIRLNPMTNDIEYVLNTAKAEDVLRRINTTARSIVESKHYEIYDREDGNHFA